MGGWVRSQIYNRAEGINDPFGKTEWPLRNGAIAAESISCRLKFVLQREIASAAALLHNDRCRES
jgi:hypothetical protein